MTLLAGLALVDPYVAAGQNSEGTVRVRAIAQDGPVDAAGVRSGGVGSLTNGAGEAVLRLPAGRHEITVEKLGYANGVVEVEVAAGRETIVEVAMTEQAEEIEGIVVTSTRSERRIEDEPVRVEVLAREEVEEKLLMTPGDIAMMLNETSGLRVQNTPPRWAARTSASRGSAAATRRSSRMGSRSMAGRAARSACSRSRPWTSDR